MDAAAAIGGTHAALELRSERHRFSSLWHLQVFGAAGVSPEHRVGRFYRDAKILQIVEGSNDVHRALIGEIELGLRSSGEKTSKNA